MKIPWNWPWVFFQSKCAPRLRSRKHSLGVEVLEDRLALSTTTVLGPVPLTYDQWSQMTYHLDDLAVSTPQIVNPQTTAIQGMEDTSLIGLDKVVANYPYRGTGYSVAILDTGIDYNNPALGSGWGQRVVAGWDFVNNDADPMDDNGHGTHVAGIIGSSDSTYTGIAPNVNFIALKVLGADGSGSFGNIEKALQWVADHQTQYNIVAVNLSLGSGNYLANPFTFLDDDLARLNQEGVFVAAAAGNSYYTNNSQQGLAFPAISSGIVSVGAVWDGDFGSMTWLSGARDLTTAPDRIASFTQRSAGLDLLAPGAMITSTYLHNEFATMAGTSMATPVVAGSAVLIHQAMDSLGQHSQANQTGILQVMQNTGVTVNDGDDENDNVVNTDLNFHRLDLWAAISSLGANPDPGSNQPPTLDPIGDQKMGSNQTLLVPLSADDPDGDTLTFAAQVKGDSSQAYQLRQLLDLTYVGTYFINSWGANEKWLLGNGNQWYCLLPNGELRLWATTMEDTLLPANLIATLGVAFYNDPSLLWNAAAPNIPAVTFKVVNNQLQVTVPAGYTGTFQVEVTVSDGQASASQAFQVNVVGNSAPVFQGVGDITLKANVASTITLTARDADGNALTYGARLGGLSMLAVQLKKSLGLYSLGSFYLNAKGAGEKWLGGSGGKYYLLFPNGELRRWTGTLAGTLGSTKTLVGQLDATFFQDPRKLTSPVQPVFKVVGNKLTIVPPRGFLGSFVVEASVSDKQIVTRQTFTVTVVSQVPTLVALETSKTSSSLSAITWIMSTLDTWIARSRERIWGIYGNW